MTTSVSPYWRSRRGESIVGQEVDPGAPSARQETRPGGGVRLQGSEPGAVKNSDPRSRALGNIDDSCSIYDIYVYRI